ncbi:MAG: hypothetical protein M1832_002446 [Thelocarpon impressellum]|nr:MAG: hypothetical protein M1832_002446 [Thelocarpon impressellum]
MPAISPDDPLWAVRRHAGPLADDHPLLLRARDLIDHGPSEILAPEVLAGAREKLHQLLQMSRDQGAAASYIIHGFESGGLVEFHRKVHDACMFFTRGTSPAPMSPPPAPSRPVDTSPTDISSPISATSASGRRPPQLATTPTEPSPTKRSSTFSRWVKANNFCRVTGEHGDLHACHILPYLHRNQEPKAANFLDLLGALFGAEAVDALIRNVLNTGGTAGDGIDRHDNGIALRPHLHSDWDRTLFFLEVDWATLVPETGEFVCRFRSDGPLRYTNFWNPPTMGPRGVPMAEFLVDGSEIPVRRARPVNGRELPLPSPFLLYVREVVGRVAHMMGAAEWQDLDDSESDYWEEPVAATVPTRSLLPPRGPAKDGGVSDWLQALVANDDDASSSAASWPGDVVIASG